MVTQRRIFYYLTSVFSALWVAFAIFGQCFIALIFVSLSVVTFTGWFITICIEESQANYTHIIFDGSVIPVGGPNIKKSSPIENKGERIILFDD